MTDPNHKPGDVVNGHRLTVQPDGSLAWLPVTAEPQHKPGDVVNGYRLTDQNGTLTWLPVAAAEPKKKSRTGQWIAFGVSAAAVLALLTFAIVSVATYDRPAETVADVPAAEVAEPEPEPSKPERLTVPDVTGMTAAQAVSTLRAAGFEVADPAEPSGIVTTTAPAKGGIAEEGSTVTLTVEPPLTMGQQQAVLTAEDYLDSSSFSRTGLIGQLEYEGFSTEDATFAVDYVAPDWNEQAALTAADYLDSSSFSRQGLIDQLIYEGFTPEQAEFGVTSVGY